jgi:hypothetical protein
MLGTLAACLRFRRPRGRGRRSPRLHGVARLASAPVAANATTAAVAARFVPPVFLVRRNPDRFASG